MEQKNPSEVPYRDFMLAKYKELYACLSRQVEILERQLRCQDEYIRFLEGRLAGEMVASSPVEEGSFSENL